MNTTNKFVIACVAAHHDVFRGMYVAKFSNRGQGMVVITKDPLQIKRFAAREDAEAFVAKYADRGYGLSRSGCVIQEVLS